MEDVGMRCVREVRAREEVVVNGDDQKRQKLLQDQEEEQVVIKPAAAAAAAEEKESGNNNSTRNSNSNSNSNSGGGGLLDNILAKLSSPTPTDANANANADANGESNGNDGGGGVIDNIISTIFRRGGSGEDEEVVKAENKADEGKQNDDGHGVEESEGSSGKSNATVAVAGSIISNLLPDEIAPASSDEASILIHSVVHD